MSSNHICRLCHTVHTTDCPRKKQPCDVEIVIYCNTHRRLYRLCNHPLFSKLKKPSNARFSVDELKEKMSNIQINARTVSLRKKGEGK